MSNNGLGISLSDYQNGAFDGGSFGSASTNPESLAELSKALEAGQITGRETTDSVDASGAPLKVESLESTLKHLTFKESDIVFWRMINKSAAYNTVEEFNQLVSYGSDRGGFNSEGELPEEEDSVYRRRAEHVKFLGVTKSVSHPMQLVRTQPGIGGIVQREVKNGTMWILRKIDKALAFGNEKIIPQEFNGFYAQHENSYNSLTEYWDSDVLVDLRGAHMTEDVIEDAANAIIENYGYADCIIAPPVVLSDFVKNFLTSKLISPNSNQVTAGVMGQKVTTVQTQFGSVQLKYDKFIKTAGSKVIGALSDSSKAPAAPVAGAVPAVAADGQSIFQAADAGDYRYAVAAINRYGESALSILGAANLTVAAGDRVDLTFTAGGGAYGATGYVIYRTDKNPGVVDATTAYYPLYSISTSELAAGYDGAAALKVGDRNRWLPGCQQAYMLENTTDVLEFKQLAPLMKMDLAVLSPATRFMILLYGTPQLYAPRKTVRFINIGRFA